MSDDEKSPVESLLDVFVYAPIGLIFDGPSLLPTLIERGRNQVAMARTLGEFAVQQGQTEATKAAARVAEQAGEALAHLLSPAPPAAPTPAPAPRSAPASSPPSSNGSTGAGAPEAADAPAVADLAIPDYDSLSASQVVNRLAGLSSDELDAVRSYEAAGRGRKTVLNKVAQLQRA